MGPTKDWIQAASWVVAVLAGLFGVWKIVVELRASREQRLEELRWRKARAAKELNDEMLDNPGSKAAMTMLDWDGRDFEVTALTGDMGDTQLSVDDRAAVHRPA